VMRLRPVMRLPSRLLLRLLRSLLLDWVSRDEASLKIVEDFSDAVAVAIEGAINFVDDDAGGFLLSAYGVVGDQVIDLVDECASAAVVGSVDFLPVVAAVGGDDSRQGGLAAPWRSRQQDQLLVVVVLAVETVEVPPI
jgi:hypothetical protein